MPPTTINLSVDFVRHVIGPGSILDALVHSRLFKQPIIGDPNDTLLFWAGDATAQVPLPRYSRDWTLLDTVLQELHKQGWGFKVRSIRYVEPPGYPAEYRTELTCPFGPCALHGSDWTDWHGLSAYGNTLLHSVCMAAVLATYPPKDVAHTLHDYRSSLQEKLDGEEAPDSEPEIGPTRPAGPAAAPWGTATVDL